MNSHNPDTKEYSEVKDMVKNIYIGVNTISCDMVFFNHYEN